MRLYLPDERWRDGVIESLYEKVAADTLRAVELDTIVRDFPAHLAWLRARSAGEVPAAQVPDTQYWMIVDDVYVGRITLRHWLDAELEELGGHVGYEVRPGFRRRGFASSALAQVLPRARARGLTRVLLTCDATNLGSIGAIERNRGVLADELQIDDRVALTRRYWIAT